MKKIKTYIIMVARTYPAGHIHQGQSTDFAQKIADGEKIHTIRTNYTLWAERILEVQCGRAVLELRQWQGRPYYSGHTTLATLTAADGVGIQGCRKLDYGYAVDDHFVDSAVLAYHDGLTVPALESWFRRAPKNKAMALIHFSPCRYTRDYKIKLIPITKTHTHHAID